MAKKETACVGPPGTGKTTWLARQIELACERHDPSSVYVMSFTKAAATELGERKLAVPKNNAGTIHARAFDLLGRPRVAETLIDEFNAKRPRQDQLTSRGLDADFDAGLPGERATEADHHYETAQVLRAKLIGRDHWPLTTRSWFEEEWEPFKQEVEAADFTDFLEDAAAHTTGGDFATPPRVMMVDEAQDCSPLELRLVRRWAEDSEHLVLAGDPDQSIYAFKGAVPNGMFEYSPSSDSHFRSLRQSYRIPGAVHRLARQWVQTISDRVDSPYDPREEEGELIWQPYTWKAPEQIGEDAFAASERGETTMILASCSYQIEPIRRYLRSRSIPFGNPYRLKRHDWNPLGGAGRGTSAADRVYALSLPDQVIHGPESRFWTWAELGSIIKPLGKAMFPRGSRKALEELCAKKVEEQAPPPSHSEVWDYFHPRAFDCLLAGDLDEYYLCLQPSMRSRYAYPINVAKRYGFGALRERPKIILSSIHAVKGGQADNVWIFPDVSAGAASVATTEGRDHIARTFYVGATRARKALKVAHQCEPFAAEGFEEMAKALQTRKQRKGG